ncbi:unnamed protein product [Miscanthus lutarioriparius]|uniref:Transcription factor IIIC subunit 5 HTH domain-containing protein n=1 Tax=Miscanthus lutarioriparius TaxID=422564 RepID=A0A811NA64_9POAL|nr:unnamed protein product [Miscanthus lutarioriparius]
MASSHSPHPPTVPPEPVTPPSPWTITDGAISGMLPAAEAFAVHYPGYPSSPADAARILGDLPGIAKVWSSDPSARLELASTPRTPIAIQPWRDPARPPAFCAPPSRYFIPSKDRPTKIALLPSSNALSKTMHRRVVQERWEMNVGPTLALPFNTQVVPEKINWEDHVRKNSVDWDWQMAVCKLFDEHPVWPRQSLYERLLDDGVHVSQNQFKRLLFRAEYYFSTGPFGKFWIRRGYDPRKDSESRIYQRIDFRMPPELRYLLRPKNSGS